MAKSQIALTVNGKTVEALVDGALSVFPGRGGRGTRFRIAAP